MMLEVITDAVTGEVTTREYIPIPPTADEVRAQRNSILATSVDPLAGNILRWNDLNAERQQAWADYRRALLDIPQQAGFPENVIWPTAPSEVI
jgi:hypothetical protein